MFLCNNQSAESTSSLAALKNDFKSLKKNNNNNKKTNKQPKLTTCTQTHTLSLPHTNCETCKHTYTQTQWMAIKFLMLDTIMESRVDSEIARIRHVQNFASP